MAELKTLLDGLTFPEGPRWHNERLWFSDFYSHSVIAADLQGNTEIICKIPNQPSGLGWLPDNRLLVVSMTDQKVMRLDANGLKQHADISNHAHFWCNDMTVDNKGHAFVGNFGFNYRGKEEPRKTVVARVDPDGSVHIAANDLFFPNGIAITPDDQTLVIAESWGRRLTAFQKSSNGRLSNRRIWAEGGNQWIPDGICMDAEAAIWIADPVKKQVLRIRDGGNIAEIVPTGDRGAYAVALGGEDRQTLFICTNTHRNSDYTTNRTGRIEMIRVNVPGAGWP